MSYIYSVTLPQEKFHPSPLRGGSGCKKRMQDEGALDTTSSVPDYSRERHPHV